MLWMVDNLEKAIKHLKDKPVKFARKVVGFEPFDWQAHALREINKGNNVAIKACNNPGKTALAAIAGIHYLCTNPYAKIPCTAPTQDQLKDALWGEYAQWINKSGLDELLEVTNTEVRVRGYEKSYKAMARSSSNPQNLAGKHSDHLLYCLDEADQLEEEVFDVVEGAMAEEDAQLLMLTNPRSKHGYFAECFTDEQKSKRFTTFTISARGGVEPRYPGDYHYVSDNISQDWVQQKIEEKGEDSPFVTVFVDGCFPEQNEDTLIRYDLLQEAVTRDLTEDPETCELGVDFGGEGEGETVIAERRGDVLIDIERYDGNSTMVAASKVVEKIERLRNDDQVRGIKVKPDRGPVGKGAIDKIKEEASERGWDDVHIIPVGFGGSVLDEEYQDILMYAGEEMWVNLRDKSRDGSLDLLDDDQLIEELSSRRYKLTSKGKLKLEKKSKMQSRGEPSPDTADAVVLAFYDVEPEDNEVDLTGINIGSIEGSSYWKTM